MRWLGKEKFRLIRGQKGVSLIETVIALALLGIIGVAFLSGLTTTSRALMANQESVIAESLAKSQLEHIKTQAYIPVEEYVGANCYEEIAIPDDLVGKYEIEIINPPDPIDVGDGEEAPFEVQSITVVIKLNGKAVLSVSSYRCGSSA